ncbi:MAG: PilT protein domain protein [Chthoniobacteraceae bacterium]|nr:PilT protein domain protein [Chthoniobacteraceae bacterium]
MSAPGHSFRYLLDTNIVSDLIRNPGGEVAAAIARVGSQAVCINVVIAGEICFGVRKRNSPRLTTQAEKILRGCEVLPMEAPLEKDYAAIRHALELHGTPIGPNDLWIAAHALAANLILVTDNVSEFSRVAGLAIENWLKPAEQTK